MKKLIFTLSALCLISPAYVQAQKSFAEKLQSFTGQADTIGKFTGSKYMVVGNGKLVLNDGTEQDGTIEFAISTQPADMSFVQFTKADEMKPKVYRDKDVAYFTVNGHMFYPVKIKIDETNIGNTRFFVEMLNEKPENKFKMYLMRQVAAKPAQFSQNGAYEVSSSFYVLLPDFKVAHGLEDLVFTPFAKKMSEFLKDCPAVANKIKNKEEGYKYNMFKGAANREVFYRIMEEYNACQ